MKYDPSHNEGFFIVGRIYHYMKYIITESQFDKLFLSRRVEEIKSLVKSSFSYEYPCDFEDFGSFLSGIESDVLHTDNVEWIKDEHFKPIKWYIHNIMKDELRDYYVNMCRDNY